jgi:hypothetical protein
MRPSDERAGALRNWNGDGCQVDVLSPVTFFHRAALLGTFNKVSAKYSPLYAAEFQSRYNDHTNPEIFGAAIAGYRDVVPGRRLSLQAKKSATKSLSNWNCRLIDRHRL